MKQSFRIPEHLLNRPIRIKLAGVGGTGSQFCDALASLEVTLRALGHPGFEVSLFDADTVSRSNVGRQRFTRCDIGQSKAMLLTHRINLFYGLAWNAIPTHLHERDASCDLLVTCTDSARVRAAIGKQYARTNTEALWLDFGNGPATGQVVIGHLGKPSLADGGLRLPNVFDLFPELDELSATDREAPSCSVEEAITRQEWPVNRMVAALGAALLWNLIRKGEIEHHGCFIDTRTLQSRPLPVDPEGWAMFGYAPKRNKSPKRKPSSLRAAA